MRPLKFLHPFAIHNARSNRLQSILCKTTHRIPCQRRCHTFRKRQHPIFHRVQHRQRSPSATPQREPERRPPPKPVRSSTRAAAAAANVAISAQAINPFPNIDIMNTPPAGVYTNTNKTDEARTSQDMPLSHDDLLEGIKLDESTSILLLFEQIVYEILTFLLFLPLVECPMCGEFFTSDIIEPHASNCQGHSIRDLLPVNFLKQAPAAGTVGTAKKRMAQDIGLGTWVDVDVFLRLLLVLLTPSRYRSRATAPKLQKLPKLNMAIMNAQQIRKVLRVSL